MSRMRADCPFLSSQVFDDLYNLLQWPLSTGPILLFHFFYSHFNMKTTILPICLLAAGMLLGSHSKSVAQTSATYIGSPTGYSASIGLTGTYNAGWTHSYVGFNAKRVGGSWETGTDGSNNGATLLLGNIAGELRFFTLPSDYTTTGAQTFTDSQINSMTPQMVVGSSNGSNGNPAKPVYVKIGAMSPTGTHADYALSVDGKVVTRSVYVTSQNWADFVFEPTYQRLTLPALEQYLQLNKHLPSIPSAKEVEANGYSLGEMDAKMLQSVEELTLYVIELNKRNEQLTSELAALRVQVAQQAARK